MKLESNGRRQIIYFKLQEALFEDLNCLIKHTARLLELLYRLHNWKRAYIISTHA